VTRARAAALAVAALALGAALPAASPRARAAGNTPVISNVSPSKGPAAGGTTVTITGTDFVAPMAVTFDGLSATNVNVTSPTTITCTTPAHPLGPVNVVVTQTTPPASPSAPGVNAYTYEDPPVYLWVPRAPGSATGGNPGGYDVTLVDFANRKVAGSLDLNASDPDLPNDDDWRVTQVLFDESGDTAFLATAGAPGALNSQKVFVVRTARAAGVEAGNPILSVIDTDGNPYQLARNALGTRLYVADGGDWDASASSLPNGTFRAYDVTDRAAPVSLGTPAAVGVFPVLAYDAASYQGWGRNSAFKGVVQAKGNRCVVTNAGSHTLSVVDVSTLGVQATRDVGVPTGGQFQLTTSIPTPFGDDFVFVQTTDLVAQVTEYFIYRISNDTLTDRGSVAVPMSFFPVLPSPDPSSRQAWPHPDGESLVAIPATDASVATWNPGTGSAPHRAAVQGGGPPASLAYNDESGFFYAREQDGGWTVFTVPGQVGEAPAEVVRVPEATGVDSLRVVGNGDFLVGTGPSNLAVVDGKIGSATIHTVTGNVALPLNPLGGPVYPQPGTAGAPPRIYVDVAGGSTGSIIVEPIAGTVFDAQDGPPEFEIGNTGAGVTAYEIELGSQYDFLPVPGSVRARVRVPTGEIKVTPDRRAWLRVLRASAGLVERPFYARVNRILVGGVRLRGETTSFRIAAPVTPILAAPADGASASAANPPVFQFSSGQPGIAILEFRAEDPDAQPQFLGSYRVPVTGGGPQSVTPSDAAWRAITRAARRGSDGTLPADAVWRVVVRDSLGRRVPSAERDITITN
jgi:hypothetical protein